MPQLKEKNKSSCNQLVVRMRNSMISAELHSFFVDLSFSLFFIVFIWYLRSFPHQCCACVYVFLLLWHYLYSSYHARASHFISIDAVSNLLCARCIRVAHTLSNKCLCISLSCVLSTELSFSLSASLAAALSISHDELCHLILKEFCFYL